MDAAKQQIGGICLQTSLQQEKYLVEETWVETIVYIFPMILYISDIKTLEVPIDRLMTLQFAIRYLRSRECFFSLTTYFYIRLVACVFSSQQFHLKIALHTLHTMAVMIMMTMMTMMTIMIY
uniref:Uncharacterized protein n=1 Tax=Glossina brevipalpis TaxID=37001 RepID=A0A1A9W005_9MUSC